MRILSMIAVAVFLSTLAPQARADMAADCAQEHDPDLSIGGCTAVIHSGEWQGTDLAWTYYNRGSANDDLGDYRRAIEDYDQALRLDPDYAFAYGNRGTAYYKLGEYRRAIEDFGQTLRLDPSYGSAYYNRGTAYDDLGEFRRAIADYDQTLRLDPGDGSAYQNRGVSHESLSEYARAAEDWERAIRIDGATRAKWWQNYMKGKGHYAGAIDGVFNPGLRRDLLACAIDPAC